MAIGMIEYFRERERAEREAMHNAACEQARWAHEQMADAYARRAVLEELKASGALAAGKLATIAEARLGRDDSEHGRRAGTAAAARGL